MSTDATVTSKGQTTIPKKIRDELQMKAGDRLTFTLLPDRVVLMRVKDRNIMDVAGKLRKPGRKAMSIEQLSR
jgi:AbrB family looped-hinge helix DNA binding protein